MTKLRLQFGARQFAPSVVATLVMVMCVMAFVGMGMWQLNRAQQKRALVEQALAGQGKRVDAADNLDSLPRYQRVSLTGTYDSAHQVLLDSMPSTSPNHRGESGYRVWTPMQLTSGLWVLVDRGWVPRRGGVQTPSGAPPSEAPRAGVSLEIDAQHSTTITGMVDEFPRPGIRMGAAGLSAQWPQVLNYPLTAELRTLYGPGLASRLVLLDPDNPNGFERSWQINQGFGPERHVAYALQWFAFGATLLIIFVVVNLKPTS